MIYRMKCAYDADGTCAREHRPYRSEMKESCTIDTVHGVFTLLESSSGLMQGLRSREASAEVKSAGP